MMSINSAILWTSIAKAFPILHILGFRGSKPWTLTITYGNSRVRKVTRLSNAIQSFSQCDIRKHSQILCDHTYTSMGAVVKPNQTYTGMWLHKGSLFFQWNFNEISWKKSISLNFISHLFVNNDSHVFLLPIQKKISEQPCSNGEPIRHTVLWEGIRTTHKPSESPMGHVPMGTTDAQRCV
jgi:hypothetical protein